MIGALLDGVSGAVADFVGVLSDGLTSVAGLFYTVSDGVYQFTFLGSVALIAVGAGLVWLVYRLIKGAIRGIGK